MIINSKNLTHNTILHHFVLSMTHEALADITKKQTGDYDLDVQMTVNGHKLPIENVLNHFENQLSTMIEDKAKELLEELTLDKIYDISNILTDIEEQLEEKITILLKE